MNKRLYRVEEGKMLCGVCSGLGEYFNLDPTIIRVAFVLFSCIFLSGVVAYIILAIIIPAKDGVSENTSVKEVIDEKKDNE